MEEGFATITTCCTQNYTAHKTTHHTFIEHLMVLQHLHYYYKHEVLRATTNMRC